MESRLNHPCFHARKINNYKIRLSVFGLPTCDILPRFRVFQHCEVDGKVFLQKKCERGEGSNEGGKLIVLTKCFGELSQILEYFGCDKSVLELSCGIGDIFLTCSTTNSRNFKFGANFANGIEDFTQTVEGLRSFEFIRKLPIEIPILKGYSLITIS